MSSSPGLNGRMVPQYILTAHITDGQFIVATNFTVNVTIVNNAPEWCNLPNVTTIEENTPLYTTVYTFCITDKHEDNLTYTLAPTSYFQITNSKYSITQIE